MDFWLKFERMDGVWFFIGEWVKKTVHRKEGSEQLFRKNIKNRKKVYLKYLENMEKGKSFLSLSLCNKSIDKKLEKAKNIYVEEEKYIAYKIGLIDGLKIKNEWANFVLTTFK